MSEQLLITGSPARGGERFQAAAVRASLARFPAGAPSALTDIAVSCCLPASPDADEQLRSIRRKRWFTLICGIAGHLGFPIIMILLILTGGLMSFEHARLAGLAMFGCFLLGWAMTFQNPLQFRLLVRAALRERANLPVESPFRQTIVGIEDAATYHRRKVMPEDAGVVAFDPANNRVLIEGIACRYVFYAADLIGVRQVRAPSGSEGVEITYQIGEAQLALTLSIESVFGDLLRKFQMGPAEHPLLQPARRCLGMAA